jgi:predicted amidophosphoribosyltransferase
MSTAIKERTKERTSWVCENCQAEAAAVRKRCEDCGTSRY